MPDDNLLATLEQSLRQTRATRNRLAARLADLELEAEKLRTELGEMDAIATQTEAAMFRILSSVLNTVPAKSSSPSDAEIDWALRRDEAQTRNSNAHPPTYQTGPRATHQTVPRATLPPVRADVEVTSELSRRTIPQATAMLLPSRRALHVNEIYNRLLDGVFSSPPKPRSSSPSL